MPVKFCCCFSNLTACIVIANLCAMSRIILALSVYTMFQLQIMVGEWIFIEIEIVITVFFIVDILLLIGSINKINGLLISWLIFAGLGMGLQIVGIVGTAMKGTIGIPIGTSVHLILTFWAVIAVLGGIKEIKNQESNDIERF